ncbi:MAG: IS4 family transposase [Cyanobacteria bacterium P01_A01_bin.40]
MFVSNFPKIIKHLFKDLPKNDYPVLNSFFFTSCWIGFAMDKSLVSMRDLLTRVNSREKRLDISTFSKASKTRSVEVFQKVLSRAIAKLENKMSKNENKIYFPLDSTIITLTSKLLRREGYHQVKLFGGLNSFTSGVEGIVIHFGQGNDNKYGNKTIEKIPEKGIRIMDRGFCSKERIRNLLKIEDKFFVLRVKNNMKLKMLDNGNCILGTERDNVETRIVSFCSLENNREYRLATNLSESEYSNEEVGEIYRKHWAIETLWKFLKMHLKLDNLITNNENGIAIQVYSCLVGYIILQLTKIPKEIGDKSLDKLRYLQSFMNENISYIHWFRKAHSSPHLG